MSIDTGQKFVDAFVAGFAPDMNSTAQNVAMGMIKVEYQAHKAQPDQNIAYANGTVQTVAENATYTFTLDTNVQVQFMVDTFKITAMENVAAANTNIAIVQLCYNNGAGGSDTNIFVGNTAVGGGIGALTSAQPSSLTVNAANAVVASAKCLQVKITKSGAGGLILPGLSFEVRGHRV